MVVQLSKSKLKLDAPFALQSPFNKLAIVWTSSAGGPCNNRLTGLKHPGSVILVLQTIDLLAFKVLTFT